jgi:hypothetical protein
MRALGQSMVEGVGAQCRQRADAHGWQCAPAPSVGCAATSPVTQWGRIEDHILHVGLT